MKDLTICLGHRPGALAEMGETLGRAGISVEGGGAFAVDDQGVAHFLVQDGESARRALEAAGIRVEQVRDVVQLRLDQETPGQLGLIARRMAEAGVSIEVLYTDHQQQLTLVVDNHEGGLRVAQGWESRGWLARLAQGWGSRGWLTR